MFKLDDSAMENNSDLLSDIVVSFLLSIGENKKTIKQCSYNSRLYHDLDNWGDDGWDFKEILQQQGVDMSTFVFSDYFPPEFPDLRLHEKVVYYLTFGFFYKDTKFYKPITMRMIEKVLIAKDWATVLEE